MGGSASVHCEQSVPAWRRTTRSSPVFLPLPFFSFFPSKYLSFDLILGQIMPACNFLSGTWLVIAHAQGQFVLILYQAVGPKVACGIIQLNGFGSVAVEDQVSPSYRETNCFASKGTITLCQNVKTLFRFPFFCCCLSKSFSFLSLTSEQVTYWTQACDY